MSYTPKLLFAKIVDSLDESPSRTLGNLQAATIEGAVQFVTGGTFELLRQEILLAQVRTLFACEPTLSIKELGFSLGFKSPTSFAHSVKRASGFSPEELRIRCSARPFSEQTKCKQSLRFNRSAMRCGHNGVAAIRTDAL